MAIEVTTSAPQHVRTQRLSEGWFRPLAQEPEVVAPSENQVAQAVAFLQHPDTRQLATMSPEERQQKLSGVPSATAHQMNSLQQLALHLGGSDWDTIAGIDVTRPDGDQERIEAAVSTLSLQLARLELRLSPHAFALGNPCFGYPFIATW